MTRDTDLSPEARALEWLVLLQEDRDPARRDAHLRWLAEDPGHARAWAEVSHTWQLLGQAAEEAGLAPEAIPAQGQRRRPAEGWRSGSSDLASSGRGPGRRQVLKLGGIIAGTAAAGLAGVACLRPALLRMRADLVTDTAETEVLDLPDGSRAVLAAESAVALDFGEGRRGLRLLNGQVFLEVRPDAQRPFTVAARDLRIAVVGTAFEVALPPSGPVVSVSEGHVRASAAVLSATDLRAGDWLALREAGIARGRIAPDQVAGWRQGLLSVEDRPVPDVVDEIARYFDGHVRLVGRHLDRLRITGTFDLRAPRLALQAVALAHGARIDSLGSHVLILSGWS